MIKGYTSSAVTKAEDIKNISWLGLTHKQLNQGLISNNHIESTDFGDGQKIITRPIET